MNINNIIERIILLPRLVKSTGNKPIYTLLKDTGYFEIAEQIDEDDFNKALKQHPECINEWLALSDDKRTSSGWYFKELDNEKYVVGYLDLKETDHFDVEFSDIADACAFFIKHEIDNSRLI